MSILIAESRKDSAVNETNKQAKFHYSLIYAEIYHSDILMFSMDTWCSKMQ